jgi:hypothetical protein
LVGGDGAFAADTPVIAAEFDDGRGRSTVGAAGIEDQRNAIAELPEDFLAGFTGGTAGEIGTRAGYGNADFRDETIDDFVFGPAESDAPGVACHFEWETVGGIDDKCERTGPAGLRQAVEIVGEFLGENLGKADGIDENGKSALFGASFDAEDFFDRGEIYGIGGESVERVGRHSDDRTTIQPAGSVANRLWIGIRGIHLQYLSRQSKVPTLFWSDAWKRTRRCGWKVA